ncbi:hypothetical protein [Kluyvera sichuanensis]|uniref:hypothetical protein n=1 Tax=Kluyvera sichuanensis TaxID=2725494 RepID=UPI0039F577B6
MNKITIQLIKAGSPFVPCVIPALVIVAQLVVWAILMRYGYEKPYWAEWGITLIVSLIVLVMVLRVFYGTGKAGFKFSAFMSTVTWILALLYRVICSDYTFSIDYRDQSWLLMPGAITLICCVWAVFTEII